MTDSAVIDQAQALIAAHKTLQIASVSPDGAPHISYAPYLLHTDGHFYIFISQLAGHYKTIKQGRASLMIIEDEGQSANLFARKRIRLDCTAKFIEKRTAHETQVLDAFAARQGDTATLLRSLSDFSLVQLRPQNALLVVGFAEAHKLDDQLPQLLTSLTTS